MKLNPFMLLIVVLFIGASVWDGVQGRYMVAMYEFLAGALNLTVMFMK